MVVVVVPHSLWYVEQSPVQGIAGAGHCVQLPLQQLLSGQLTTCHFIVIGSQNQSQPMQCPELVVVVEVVDEQPGPIVVVPVQLGGI